MAGASILQPTANHSPRACICVDRRPHASTALRVSSQCVPLSLPTRIRTRTRLAILALSPRTSSNNQIEHLWALSMKSGLSNTQAPLLCAGPRTTAPCLIMLAVPADHEQVCTPFKPPAETIEDIELKPTTAAKPKPASDAGADTSSEQADRFGVKDANVPAASYGDGLNPDPSVPYGDGALTPAGVAAHHMVHLCVAGVSREP